MELTTQELQQLYTALIKPSPHPDPLGLMARILMTSEGDPDFIDVDGRTGLIPIHPDRAMEVVGSVDTQTREGNLATAMAMDLLYFEQFGEIDTMIEMTHDGPSAETRAILQEIDQARVEVSELLFPPLATVEDVIRLLKDNEQEKPNKKRMKFFQGLLNGQ